MFLFEMTQLKRILQGNILMDAGKAHLSDFGLSNVMADVRNNSFVSSTVGGAPRWTAPELLHFGTDVNVVPDVTKHSDIYSFGSVALQVRGVVVPFLSNYSMCTPVY